VATLAVRALHAGYGHKPVVRGVDFEVLARRTLGIVGPSGAGKSTLLRAIAGLGAVRSGDVLVAGRSVHLLAPQKRRIAMVFASDALVRHASVLQNLEMVMRGEHRRRRIEELAAVLEIERLLLRRPHSLSTGERQRVSIARALLCDPDVLLLDEPLAALDPELRARVRDELVHVRERFAGPIVYVTHDHAEAMAVADELAVIMDGSIVDRGAPQRVYDAPASAAVAMFLGARPMNLLPARLFGDALGDVVGIRPERMKIEEGGALRGIVARVERTGADAYVHVTTEGVTIVIRVWSNRAPAIGERVEMSWEAAAVRRFDAQTGAASP
jgi:multiple sugar transport system ATP-binding protein